MHGPGDRRGRRPVVCAAAAIVAVAAVVSAGCKRGGAKRIARDKDAQAVVVVEPTEDTVTFSDEVEPNGELAAATPLAAGAGVRGSLDGETDVDLYKLTVSEPGVLSALLSGIDEVDLILDLRDAKGTVLVRSDRGPKQTIEGLPNYPVVASVYYLGVAEFVKKRRKPKPRAKRKGKAPEPSGRVGPSPVYELVARVTAQAPPDHEVEPNSASELAREMLIGDEVVGYMGWSRDADVWKLALEGFGPQYSLDLDLQGVPGVTFTLDVLDGAGKRVLRRRGSKDGGLMVRNLVPALPGTTPAPAGDGAAGAAGSENGDDGDADDDADDDNGDDKDDDAAQDADELPVGEPADAQRHYFVKLSASRSSPVDAYRLRMSTRVLELDEEREPNDGAAQAQPLREGDVAAEGSIRGFLTPGDTDAFRLAAAEPVSLDVQITAGADIDVRLSIIDAAGAALAKRNATRRGGAESLSGVRVPGGAPVIIQVSGQGAVGDAAYTLTWTAEALSGGDSPAANPGLLDDAYGDE